jgi:hypothetical protein
MEDNLKEVYSAGEMYKIEIMQDLLEQKGINSFVLNQKGSAFLVGEIKLYVDEKDEARALEFIKNHEM